VYRTVRGRGEGVGLSLRRRRGRRRRRRRRRMSVRRTAGNLLGRFDGRWQTGNRK